MINLDLVGKKSDPIAYQYTWKDVVLYNLGVGYKATDLQFVYEHAPEGLKTIPTFAVVPSSPNMGNVMFQLNVNLMTLLHGEQATIVHQPIPTEGRLLNRSVVTNIYDKGKGALAVIKIESSTEKGEPVVDSIVSLFCRGEGGFGGDPGPKPETYDPPGRAPDFECTLQTSEDQAAIYRLSGDINPLHIDPQFAAMAGFEHPILHGLCTYGFACRAVVYKACGGDPTKLTEFKVRFTKPVFPGQAITTRGWNMGNGIYHLTASVGNDAVLTQSYAKVIA